MNEEISSTEVNNVDDGRDGIPTLVVECIIQSITDIQLLKTCRLVNKFWNYEACPALRKAAITNVNEKCITKLDEFNVVLNNRLGSALPSPFKKLSVLAENFRQDTFNDLILRPSFTIQKLFILGEDLDIGNLKSFLKTKIADVTFLCLYSVLTHSAMLNLCDVKFLSLTHLVDLGCRYTSDSDCSHFWTLTPALQCSPLKVLSIIMHSSSCLSALLTMNLSKVVDLSFQITFKGKDCWDKLLDLKLPALQRLDIGDFGTSEVVQSQEFNLFIENVAPSLVTFTTNLEFDMEMKMLFVFPKLTSIEMPLAKPNMIPGLFTSQRFPSLKDIALTNAAVEFMEFLDQEFATHTGVQRFHIKIDEEADEQEIDDIFPTWILSLARKFPNVINFGIIWLQFKAVHLFDIRRAYPHLKALRVDAFTDFTISKLSCSCKERVETKSEELSEKDILRLNCCFDFKELESLSLNFVKVCNDTIQYCLALMPKLNHLNLHWNKNVSVTAVAKSLGHLRKFGYFTNHSDDEMEINFDVILDELRTLLPNCSVYDAEDDDPWICKLYF